MKKNTLLSLVLFFCTGVLFAQNITLQINNNTTTNYTGNSLENALTSNSVALNSITHLTITAGDVTTADWTYLKAQKNNLTAMTHFTVTNSVTTVADIPNPTDYKPYFKEDTIEEVSIAKLQNIGGYTFYNCTGLTTASFPQATSIGGAAFGNCTSLTTASFPQATAINENAFLNCTSLTTASFPQATSIGNYAFGSCTNLTTASFPQATTIDDWAFSSCSGLTTASFPRATSIGGGAFYNCTSLTTLTLNATPPSVGNNAFNNTPTTRSVIVPNTTAITAYDTASAPSGDNLWYGWQLGVIGVTITDNTSTTKAISGTSLQDALTGETLANIVRMEINAGEVTTADWNYLKAEKTNLTAMTHFTVTNGVTTVADIPNTTDFTSHFKEDTIKEVSIAGVQSIGVFAFGNCTSLTTANFPQATSIGEGAFDNCTSLTTVSFPQATSIGTGAFYNCSNLTTASFPQATSIGDYAFEECTSLTTVSFPQATSIGTGAFYNCSNLTTASFPQATSIGDYTFENCASLTTLTLNATPPSLGISPFLNTPATRNLIITTNTGTPLTGTALTSAINTYDADEGANNDNLWHDWKLNGVIWTGATNQEWNTASNWYTNTVPTATDNVSIVPNIATPTNTPIIGETTPTTVTVNNVTVQTGAQLQVNPGSNITIDGDLVIQNNAIFGAGSIVTASRTLASSTVKVNGTSTIGTTNSGFVYGAQTYVDNTVGWTLISSPVAGQSIPEFTVAHDLPTNNNNYAIAVYNNDGSNWNYYTGATGAGTGMYPLATAGDFEEGKGYTVRPNSSATTLPAPLTAGNNAVYFKGNLHTSDVSIAINDKSSASGTAFNLVGNPYPSYISFSNLFTENHGTGKPLAEKTIWLWDKTTSSYVTVNHLTTLGTDMSANKRPSLHIAPTQGFFVKSNSTGGNFRFTEAMQEHQATGVFNRPSKNEITQLTLKITDGQHNEKATNIYYVAGKTVDFDNGYDSSMFGGTTTNFGVFTALVGNSQGEKLAIQALPNENYNTMVVPVGIIAEAGKEITFSNVAKNVPSDVVVYLEDRTTGAFTNLTTDTYKVTLDQAQNSTGRFFVHTKSSALSTDAVSLAGVSIYKSNATTLTITGVQTANASVQVFNLLGKQMLAEKLTTSNVNNIALPSLATGVYIVKVASTQGNATKKIIIE